MGPTARGPLRASRARPRTASARLRRRSLRPSCTRPLRPLLALGGGRCARVGLLDRVPLELDVLAESGAACLGYAQRLARVLQARLCGLSLPLRILDAPVGNLRAGAETVALANDWEWRHGAVRRFRRVAKGGLIAAVVESWYPSSERSYGLLLEDDIEVIEEEEERDDSTISEASPLARSHGSSDRTAGMQPARRATIATKTARRRMRPAPRLRSRRPRLDVWFGLIFHEADPHSLSPKNSQTHVSRLPNTRCVSTRHRSDLTMYGPSSSYPSLR